MRQIVPPNALEAEQSTLGSLMIDREAYFAVKELDLVGADFYREAHQVIFEAIGSLYEAEQQVDILTLQDEMRRRKMLEKVGGPEYLMTLIDLVPSASNAGHYARIVRDAAVRRQWIDLASRIEAAAHDPETEIGQLCAMANDGELAISRRLTQGTWTPYKEIIGGVVHQIDEAYQSGGEVKGIPSGFDRLDSLTLGWQNKELVLIAGRPSKGKTALMLQLAETAATHGYPVGIFSLEMDKDSLGYRAVQAASGMSGYALRAPRFGTEGWEKVYYALGKLSELPIYIDDEPVVRHIDIFTKARRAVLEHGVKLLMLDYSQLAEGPKGESRTREVGMVLRAMRITAKRLDVPFIALSQLSRRCEEEGNRRPKLSDLRDSGEMEQEANVCIFIHFDGKEGTPTEDNAELILAKNRQGAKGNVRVRWMPHLMRFVPRTDRES